MYKSKDLFRNSNRNLSGLKQAESNSDLSDKQYVIVHNVGLAEIASLRNLIAASGCRVKVATGFDEISRICGELKPTMVVSDCSNSPEESALQYRGIRDIQGMEQTPILFLYDNKHNKKPKMQANAERFQFMLKPIHPQKFSTKFVSILEKYSGKKEIEKESKQESTVEVPPTPFFPDISKLDSLSEPTKESEDTDIEVVLQLDPKTEPDIPAVSVTESYKAVPDKTVQLAAIEEEEVVETTSQPEQVIGSDEVESSDNTISEDAGKVAAIEPTPANEEIRLEAIAEKITAKPTVSPDRLTLYDRAVTAVGEQLRRLTDDQPINIGSLTKVGREFLEFIHDTRSLEVRALNRRKDTSIDCRIVNMTIFSALIGNKMRLSEDEMLLLLQAALLHDFGMALVPKEILETKQQVSKKEYEQIKKHIDHSVNAIINAEDYDEKNHIRIVKISRQVHEREDGSGYPLGLESEDIDQLAKVIAVCDRYEAMSHPRNYRKPFIAHVAMQKIVQLKGTELDPISIKALLQALSIFPIDSYVKLNNSQIGRVVGINKSHPMRPVVSILKDKKGATLSDPVELDLKESPFLFITSSLQPEDVE